MYKNRDEAVKALNASKQQLLTFVKAVIKNHTFRYRTFGNDIEDHIIPEIIKILTKKGIIKVAADYHVAENKNQFPDLTINTDPPIALELKVGNRCKKSRGKWRVCKNSNNDMGTLNSWKKKIKQFGTDNIYYLYIEYCFDDNQDIHSIKIEPFYKFLGLNSDGFLKYREKDGNLRPKDFDKNSVINSAKQFEKLIKGTNEYRSKRIIRKHIKNIPKKDRITFLNEVSKIK